MAEWLLLQVTAYSWRTVYLQKVEKWNMHNYGTKRDKQNHDQIVTMLEFLSSYLIKATVIYLRIISSLGKMRAINFIIQLVY